MRRIVYGLSSLTLLACQPASKPEAAGAPASEAAERPASETEPGEAAAPRRKLDRPIVRKDLVAADLPAIPSLALVEPEQLASGAFGLSPGTDELRPRAALELRDGLLVVGQAFGSPDESTPPRRDSWMWSALIPRAGGEARVTLGESGAMRAAIADGAGGGLVVGTRGSGAEAQGWFAAFGPDGQITQEAALASSGPTELLDLVAGDREGEQVVVAGYLDSQAWVSSLGATGQARWTRTIGSAGYTQLRGLARLDGGGLFGVGSQAERSGQAWSMRIQAADPGLGTEPVVEGILDIPGADLHRHLHALVDLGELGFVALGTAKRNIFQAHEQVFAIGFDRTGAVAWTRVIPELRATEVLGARAEPGTATATATATFIVALPLDDELEPETALGLLRVPADPNAAIAAQRLRDSDGWSSTGFIEGAEGSALVGFHATAAGIEWRKLLLPAP